MKKTIFILAAVAALYSAAAQDTVYWDGFNSNGNYFIYGNVPKIENIVSMTTLAYPEGGGETGKYFFSSDTLTIYGIAASIQEFIGCIVDDTSYEHSFEYLRLYNSAGDSLQCINQTQVHLHRNISYYIVFDSVYPPLDPAIAEPSSRIAEMHECYFRTPTTVVDSFYVGTTYLLLTHLGNLYHYASTPLLVNSLSGMQIANDEVLLICINRQDGTHIWHRRNRYCQFSVIFPILTPPPYVGRDTTHTNDTITAGDTVIVSNTTIVSDTTVVNDTTIVSDTVFIGNDTIITFDTVITLDTIITYDTIVTYDTILGIDDHGLLGRLTGVMPNPAAETAKVVSSFGMSRVEVYNMAGERVHDVRVPDGSLSATLDLRRLPAGAYLLRIHTPQGTATKKLTVRR